MTISQSAGLCLGPDLISCATVCPRVLFVDERLSGVLCFFSKFTWKEQPILEEEQMKSGEKSMRLYMCAHM